MHTRGAIVTQVPGRYEVVDLDLDEPRRGEVLVRMIAAGLCASDDHVVTGDMPMRTLPACGGHEGAGVVERVGPDTEGVVAGDHVVFSFLPVCGRCRWCSTGHQNLCELGAGLARGSRVGDPTSFRMHYGGQPVGQLSGVSTFSQYTTTDVRSIVIIPRDIPMDKACLVGCCVITGWGAAVNSANVQAGDVVICMGIGGIGINAVQGAAMAGASQVIAVDPVEFKREQAMKFGATSAFATIKEATNYARSITNGQGADSTIVSVGGGELIAQGFASIRKAGTLVVTGLGSLTDRGIPVSPAELVLYQKRIQGSLFGEGNPLIDVPKMLRLYTEGKLMLDELITTRYPLDDVAQGYEDMHAGLNIRGIIDFSL